MTSEAFVWVHLPGDLVPTLAGKASISNSGGKAVGAFVYSGRYLKSDRALPLDPVALPLAEQVFETTMLSGNFSVLLDAGPDTWGRRIMDLRHGPQSGFGYLLHTNGGQVGALSFSAAASIPPSEDGAQAQFASLEELCVAAEITEAGGEVSEAQAALLRAGSSAGGARPKFNIEHEGKLWIAKLESGAEANAVVNVPILEAATLDLARLAGIKTPNFEIHMIARRRVLLVERFDREWTGAGWSRFRYASARTVFHSNPELQQRSFSGSYGRLAREFGRWSDTPAHDRLELFRRMAFNCIVSNTDDHELNHGLVADRRGFVLSPAFDIVPQPGATRPRYLALIIGDEGAAATRSNVLSIAPVFGFSSADAEAIVAGIERVVSSEWQDCLSRHGAGKKMVASLARRFESRYFSDGSERMSMAAGSRK